MGRYVKNLRAFKGNAKFMSGSHKFVGSLEINDGSEAVALFQSGSTNIESFAYFKSTAVGIGTSSPEGILHVQSGSAGTIAIIDGALLILESDYKPKIHLQSPGAYGGSIIFGSPTDNDEGQIDYDHTTDRFLFKTGGNTKMTILGDKVGIGTSAPTSILTVAGDITPDASLTRSLGTSDKRWESIFLGTGSVHLGPTCTISTNEASGTIIANKPFVVEGGLILSSSSYINFSPTTGSTGYGFRDNAGAMEYKSTGSEWLPVGSSGKLIRNRNTIVTNYTVTSNDSIIGVNATASLAITLPRANTLTTGQCFLIKDQLDNFGTYNVTINISAGSSDTIEGEASFIMDGDGAGMSIYTDGSSKYFLY